MAAPPALESLLQDSFAGGIWRATEGQRAPKNTAYDIINGLIDDDLGLYRRGGSEYVTTSDAGETLLGVASINIPTYGDFVIAWGTATIVKVSGAGWVSVPKFAQPKALRRGVGVGDYWFAAATGPAPNYVVIYDGALGAAVQYVAMTSVDAVGVVGTVPRMLIGDGNKVWFSRPGLLGFAPDSYHQMPQLAQVVGLDALGDTAIVFTTNGIYTISGMDLDPLDDAGNVQHSVAVANKDIVLWGDAGLAAFAGALIVPAIDDVVLFAPGSPVTTLSENIRSIYRGYVKAGHKPGIAAVYRGHYLLPVVDASNVLVDVLVCRLDRGGPVWTRWAGHAACTGYVVKIGSASARTPKLHGIKGQRLIDLSGCFAPAAAIKNDADGTTHQLEVVTRDFAAHHHLKTFWHRLRARTQIVDAAADNPTISCDYAVEGGAYVAITGDAVEGDGSVPHTWRVRKRAQAIRFRLRSVGPAASVVIRSLEVFYRRGGRQ